MLQDGDKGAIIQRDGETYAIAPHAPCGLVQAEDLRRIADAADKYGIPAIKITSASRIALIGVKEEQIDQIWSDLDMDAGHPIGLCIRSIKACPGTTFCKLGKRDSMAMGLYLDTTYHGVQIAGKMKLGVSGCVHDCAETCIKDIGLVAKPKGWDLRLGGNGGGKPRLSETYLTALDEDQAKAAVDAVLAWYGEHAKAKERLGRTIGRVGRESLEEALASIQTPAN